MGDVLLGLTRRDQRQAHAQALAVRVRARADAGPAIAHDHHEGVTVAVGVDLQRPSAVLVGMDDDVHAGLGDNRLQVRHLRRIHVETPSGTAAIPAPAPIVSDQPRRYGAVPALGQHADLPNLEAGR